MKRIPIGLVSFNEKCPDCCGPAAWRYQYDPQAPPPTNEGWVCRQANDQSDWMNPKQYEGPGVHEKGRQERAVLAKGPKNPSSAYSK